MWVYYRRVCVVGSAAFSGMCTLLITRLHRRAPRRLHDMPSAEELRLAGNKHFGSGQFSKAIELYSAAIELEPTASLYTNRAFANLKLSFSGDAIHDADAALALDPTFVKARYRRAHAFLQLAKVKDALAEFRAVVAQVPSDEHAQANLKECEKMWKQMQFMKAIASEDSVPLHKKLNPATLSIPAAYDGPRLGDDLEITEEFVMGMVKRFKEEKLVSRRDLIAVLFKAREALAAQPNVTNVTFPESEHLTVCGDTHGQYYDLLNIFENLNGFPSKTNRYLFNGDFVDRGSYSLENVTVLLAFKALYPNHFFLSRGNHESLGLNRMYGFEGEVKAKYDAEVFQVFQEVFYALPLAHILNNKVFVTHGGLFAKDGVTIADIQKVDRFRDLPEDGLMVEMLWSDPRAASGRASSKRGVGVEFGEDVTNNFLKTNNLELIVRSHEVSDNGFVKWHGDRLITIFSAPNYCDQIGNKGAYIRFDGATMMPDIKTFTHVKHPGKQAMAYSAMRQMGMGM